MKYSDEKIEELIRYIDFCPNDIGLTDDSYCKLKDGNISEEYCLNCWQRALKGDDK